MMGEAIRTVAPTALPITLAEFKAHARIDSTDEEAVLAWYIRSAVEAVEQHARLSLITQTWEQRFPTFATELTVRVKPIQSVESVEYLDSGEVLQTLDSGVYRVAGIGADKSYPRIRRGASQTWPTTAEHPEALRVTVVAGYGDTHNDVPELLRHSIAWTAAYFEMNREATELPEFVKNLLRDWRPLAVA